MMTWLKLALNMALSSWIFACAASAAGKVLWSYHGEKDLKGANALSAINPESTKLK
jgi:hypothetical protein